MKYSNYLILFVLLLSGVLLQDKIQISTNLLSLFASKESLQKLHIANELGYSKEMFILHKGLSKDSKKNMKAIAQALAHLQEVSQVHISIEPSKEMEKYFQEYYPLLAIFNGEKLSQKDIDTKMQKLYDRQLYSFLYSPLNKNDPLGLFSMQKTEQTSHKGRYLTLGEQGYLIKVTTNIEPSQMDKGRLLYTKVQKILSDYPDALAFAPFFYSVENSAKIKGDVQYIVVLSTIVLLLIYLVMLRDIKLLSHTFVALLSSMAFATLVCTTTIENFGVLSLAFGTSLTAVSIDYFFHYYFHGFYGRKRRFERSVFFGYITTAVAFGIFAFIPVPMLSQISIFALLSLSFAYLLFTFVFPHLEITQKKEITQLQEPPYKVPYFLVSVVALILFALSAYNFRFDSNIRNFDYQNTQLQNAQKLFTEGTQKRLTPVLVEAQTQAELLERLHILKQTQTQSYSFANFLITKSMCEAHKKALGLYDFENLGRMIKSASESIGFKEGYFQDAYSFVNNAPDCEDVNLSRFKSVNLAVYKEGDTLFTLAMVAQQNEALKYAWVEPIDVKAMFAQVAEGMFASINLYASIVLGAIVILLLVSVKGKFLYALNYILFPLAFALSIVSFLHPINIMHLFSFIILIAIGIDYGIYMSNTDKRTHTMVAIKFSLLSTFAAFGVLLFSTINALYSIGLVISLGVSALYFLTRVMR